VRHQSEDQDMVKTSGQEMKPQPKDHTTQLIELLRAFDLLKRQRSAFIAALGGDRDEDGRSRASLIFAAAFSAADAIATNAMADGHPAGKVDADAFRDEVKTIVLNAVDQLALLGSTVSPPDDPWPSAAAPPAEVPTPPAAEQPRRGRKKRQSPNPQPVTEASG
jgi:hypothetical protein